MIWLHENPIVFYVPPKVGRGRYYQILIALAARVVLEEEEREEVEPIRVCQSVGIVPHRIEHRHGPAQA